MEDKLFCELTERYPALEVCREEILKARDMMLDSARLGGKILICGNGGSSADADHIVGELMKGFLLKRKMPNALASDFKERLGCDAEYFTENLQCGIPAISLSAQTAISSAFINDVKPDLIYAQMVFGYARSCDLLICISTSGNSKNVVNAAKCALAMGVPTVALTGKADSALSEICTCTVKAPELETFKIQELHLPIYHYLCASVEAELFGK